ADAARWPLPRSVAAADAARAAGPGAHDPQKQVLHSGRGWEPVFGPDHAQRETRVSRHAFELLQAAHHLRHRSLGKARLPVGDADLAEIDVALRIERNAVRREELADVESGTVLAAEPRDAFAFRVRDG